MAELDRLVYNSPGVAQAAGNPGRACAGVRRVVAMPVRVFGWIGIESMTTAKRSGVEPAGDSPAAVVADQGVILSIGGKGGGGKTSVMAGREEWLAEKNIPVKMTAPGKENKESG